MTRQITIDVSDESLSAMKLAPEQAGDQLKLAAAMKMFELGRLSSGAAAQLAGIPRVEFLARLADFGIDTFQLTEDELRCEMQCG
ncbi:MAG: UPF0175 family protein [Bryobacteraceae bacterium]